MRYFRSKDHLIAAAVAAHYGDMSRAARHLIKATSEGDFPDAVDEMNTEQTEAEGLGMDPNMAKISTKSAIAALNRRGYRVLSESEDESKSEEDESEEKSESETSRVSVSRVIAALKRKGYRVVKAEAETEMETETEAEDELDLGIDDEDEGESGEETEDESGFEISESLDDGEELVIDMPAKPTGPKVPETSKSKLEAALRAERAKRNSKIIR